MRTRSGCCWRTERSAARSWSLSSGERREIRARSTLLATGGFGADPDRRAEHIHPNARDIPLRANQYSKGDGLRLGLSAGGAFGPRDAGFYGHVSLRTVALRQTRTSSPT